MGHGARRVRPRGGLRPYRTRLRLSTPKSHAAPSGGEAARGQHEQDAAGSELPKQDAARKVRPGLADKLCSSSESRNYLGEYMRHSGYRVRRDPDDDWAPYKADATWCPVRGSAGIRLSASYCPGQYLRHMDAELWPARSGGTRPWDNPESFTEDSIWAIEAP
ncbi:AbfB domain-containing protein [Streptomyces sp. NPDC051636]|uniref:AbfB domain-containing protein n=1 Tax=Streptomyces sp. NPDC051636 TaxID=3365663 RepID=UPI0037A374E0